MASVLINEAKYNHHSVDFPIKDRLRVIVTLNEKDKRRRDMDNYTKSVFDACTKNKVWEDDSQIDELLIRRGTINKDCPNVTLRIENIEYV